MKLHSVAAVSWLFLLLASAAHADDKATAEALFRQGRELLGKKDVSSACAAFEESERLDPGHIGTLLNLAECHEQLKKWARAWAEYSSASQKVAGADAKSMERRKIAADGIARLKSELSWLAIAKPTDDEAIVTLDGEPIGKATFGVELPIDPGTHEIAVSAPKKVTKKTTVTIGEVATHQTVQLPALEDEVAPPKSLTTSSAAGQASQSPPTPAKDAAANPHVETAPSHAATWILGGAGLALVAGGIGSHFLAESARSDRVDHCKTSPEPGCDGYKTSEIHTWNAVTVGSLAVGAAALTSAVVLYLTSGPSGTTTVGFGPTSVSLRGEF